MEPAAAVVHEKERTMEQAPVAPVEQEADAPDKVSTDPPTDALLDAPTTASEKVSVSQLAADEQVADVAQPAEPAAETVLPDAEEPAPGASSDEALAIADADIAAPRKEALSDVVDDIPETIQAAEAVVDEPQEPLDEPAVANGDAHDVAEPALEHVASPVGVEQPVDVPIEAAADTAEAVTAEEGAATQVEDEAAAFEGAAPESAAVEPAAAAVEDVQEAVPAAEDEAASFPDPVVTEEKPAPEPTANVMPEAEVEEVKPKTANGSAAPVEPEPEAPKADTVRASDPVPDEVRTGPKVSDLVANTYTTIKLKPAESLSRPSSMTTLQGSVAPVSPHDAVNTVNVHEILSKGTFAKEPLVDFIPYADLKAMRVEDGIDVTRKEDYLAAGEFQEVFGCSREEFTKLPQWKKQQAKKKVQLF